MNDTGLMEPETPQVDSSGDSRVRSVAVLVLVVATVLGALALLVSRGDTSGSGNDIGGAGEPGDWAGRILPQPESKPSIRLLDTEGASFDLPARTDGRTTLLMFGYTNCPDVCPINLGTLAAALDELDPNVADSIDLVFVTADPERDTPEVIRQYLDGYDRDFTGLWGTPEEIVEAQEMAKVPPAVREEADPDGGYGVGHATQIIAYQSDGIARIVYPFGTRQSDWMNDLPRLVAGETPDA